MNWTDLIKNNKTSKSECHICVGKIVDQDSKDRWILRCKVCGRIYTGVSSNSRSYNRAIAKQADHE